MNHLRPRVQLGRENIHPLAVITKHLLQKFPGAIATLLPAGAVDGLRPPEGRLPGPPEGTRFPLELLSLGGSK